MDANFWHDKWAAQEIGFHQSIPNPHLVQFSSTLKLKPEDQVLVPLCGKTNDIGWFLNQGQKICGVELNESAVQALFESLKTPPQIEEMASLKCYQCKNLKVLVGDIFNVTPDMLGPVQAVYDRAALVALPPAMRIRYTEHLRSLSHHAQQLLITFEYDQNVMAGPPHSVPDDEVRQHYGLHYKIHRLAEEAVAGGLKKTTPANEVVWHLDPSK